MAIHDSKLVSQSQGRKRLFELLRLQNLGNNAAGKESALNVLRPELALQRKQDALSKQVFLSVGSDEFVFSTGIANPTGGR